jgi:acyl-CoA reductase-like NAD-dependent aldehyde dehydrogenase
VLKQRGCAQARLSPHRNATEHGAAVLVRPRDVDRAHRFADQTSIGTILVSMTNGIYPAAPWTGYKTSGGRRELGKTIRELDDEVKTMWSALE